MTALGRRPRFFLGWTVVAVAALASFTQVAFFNPILGVFIPEFEREFGWSRTEISAAVTLGSLVGALMAPLSGPLIDRYGGKTFVAGGALAMAIALVALANMQAEWQFFIIYSVGRGLASGILALSTSVTVSKWFVRRRGYAIGVMTLGNRAGFAVLPIGVQLIIDASGWRTAAYALAMMVVTLGILPALRWLHPRPERFGLLPDGDIAVEGGLGGSAAALRRQEVSWTRAQAIRTRAFWLVTAAVSLQNWGGGAVNLHQIPHLVDKGLEPQAAALVISVSAVFAGMGSLLEGVLDSRLGARKTMVVGLVGASGGMVVLMSVDSVAMGFVFAATYGVTFGLMVTSSQIVFADYFGREALGAIRGTAAPFQLTLNAIGPIVAGVAFDLTGSYMAAFIPFTIGYLVATLCLVAAAKPSPPSVPVVVSDA